MIRGGLYNDDQEKHGKVVGPCIGDRHASYDRRGLYVKTSAAEAKTTTEYFAYRVDVLDAKKGSNDNIAVQLLSSIDGRAYVYVMYAGEEKPTEKTIMGSGNDVYLTAGEENEVYGHIYSSKIETKRTSFISHHGASTETRKAVNPVKKTIAGGNPDGKNKAVISNLNIKYTHIYENETKTYNAKKKYPMTQKELKVKEYSTPSQLKIKKVKVDSKNGQATITWETVKKAEGYEVYLSDWEYASKKGGRYGVYELEKRLESANVTEYTDKYLYQKHKYYYKVRAYYTVNGVRVYGPFSEVQEVIIVKD